MINNRKWNERELFTSINFKWMKIKVFIAMSNENLIIFSIKNFLFAVYNRERRSKFETYLLNERKKMETFRLRETKEFLSIDELKEKCDISDNFMDILKVNGIGQIKSHIFFINKLSEIRSFFSRNVPKKPKP